MTVKITTASKELSTKSIVNPKEQFSFWTDAICNTFFQLSVDRRLDGGFIGSVKNNDLDPFCINRVRSEEHIADLSKTGISKLKNHYFKLHIQNSSIAIARQHGFETILRPGDAMLLDSLYPFQLDFPKNFSSLSVIIPRELLRPMLKDPKAATKRLISNQSPINMAIKHYIHFLLKACTDQIDSDQSRLYLDNLLGLIVAGTSEGKSSAEKIDSENKFSRIKRYINTNLNDPEISPVTVAKQFFISVSYVHKLFKKNHLTFGNYLRTQRLECAAMTLQNKSNDNHTISEVAYHLGFNDLSYFWRLFRKYYGMTPKEYRQRNTKV
ncbi:helix-turn-helix domain-containing protein [Desulfobacula sp.]|uniref:helix-turn-helix domain-containing protein n=1 Tax=Desulfobacula sp. TaxID=2593537 RepID=UPI00260B6C5A|nr:helix-turn-helix domain-containing protein [Desulfobacula sp.]